MIKSAAQGGGCELCAPFTRAQGNNQFCNADTCNTSFQYLTDQGNCLACGAGTVPDGTGRGCRRTTTNTGVTSCPTTREWIVNGVCT